LNIYYFFILQSSEFSAVQNVLFLFLAAGEEEDSMPPAHPHHRSLAEHFTERDAIAMEAASRVMEHATRKMEEASRAAAMAAEEPPRKRLLTSEEERLISHVGMPSTHIKITSRSTFSSKNFNEILRNIFFLFFLLICHNMIF
jgi:hypothetical protein